MKRFITYGIIKRLEQLNEYELLNQLSAAVNATERKRGKLHEVFGPSFDAKECRSRAFINQKLNYIHNNPCTGIWDLAASPVDYTHSSASYYLNGQDGVSPLTNFMELKDIDLT